MTDRPPDIPTSGISAAFGYYPAVFNIETDRFSIQTCTNHEEKVNDVKGRESVYKDWIYAEAQSHIDFISGTAKSLPYSARVFNLPKTHVLTLHKSRSQEDLDFIVWCLSLFTGMRLTTTEAGFLDATPIKPGKLVDFILRRDSLVDAIQLALNYLESERGDPRTLLRVEAAIHSLFLAQYPQNLPFERFQYLYMALEACFSLLNAKEKKQYIPHSQRIQWMCCKFSLSVPKWADATIGNNASLSLIRNDAFHEALFFGQPLGFAVYGGNQTTTKRDNVMLQMRALICRLLVAILGISNVGYIRTPIHTRQKYKLDFKS